MAVREAATHIRPARLFSDNHERLGPAWHAQQAPRKHIFLQLPPLVLVNRLLKTDRWLSFHAMRTFQASVRSMMSAGACSTHSTAWS